MLPKEIGLSTELTYFSVEMPVRKIPSEIADLKQLITLTVKSNLMADFPL